MKVNKIFRGVSETSIRMTFRVPYLMVLFYSMAIYETDEIPTLAVNGTSMWVNPKFWGQLSREQKLTALVHEIFHKMLLHTSRRGARDPFIWNEAGDQYINNRLVAMKFVPLENLTIDGAPWSWICDPKYADPKWTTESIYDDIVKEREEEHERKKGEEPCEEDGRGEGDGEGEDQGEAGGDAGGDDDDPQPQPGGSRGKGPDQDGTGSGGEGGAGTAGEDQGQLGDDGGDEKGVSSVPRRIGSEESERKLGPMHDVRDFGIGPDGEEDNTSDESVKQFEDRVRKELKEAEQRAKMIGNVPGWLERIVGTVFHAKANWYDVLYEYLKGMSKADYSWRRFSKRELVKTGCIAPDMYQPSMGGILKFIDTSGSVSGAELGLYDKHMIDVIDQVKPKWIVLAYWDTQLHRLDRFERWEYDLDTSMLKPEGGGGTNFSDWQDVLDEMEEQPEVVLAYTDMCAVFPREELSVPTVWLSTSQVSEAPFGVVININ